VGVAGFDGIREDTFPYVPRSFWHNWSAAISKEFPNVDAVGEVFNGDSSIVAYYQGGRKANGIDTGVKCLFDYPLYYPLHRVFVQGASFEDIANDEAHDWLFADPNDLVTFIDDHDVTRFMGEPGATISELKLALTFILTNRGIPLLYYGDEIGMQGGADPDNRRDFPGGFPGDARSAFTQEGRTPQEQDVFSFVRTLTHLRAQFAPLRRGEQKTLFLSAKQWAYARTLGEESAIVIFNNDNKPATLSIPVGTLSGFTDGATLHDRLGTTPDILIEGSRVVLTLSAQSASILTK
jgi:glycosidase